ncbi:hypothetical protein HHK36_008884 [Tetracentron sinense]|uniref:RRM domain-containing protein n=1 Tax=Tetracentron sinense TaxID=13715 RepID=A0A835DHV3_TETSI|nr:hypothetical protein HHK36_008884 [Tetracentron sinense]
MPESLEPELETLDEVNNGGKSMSDMRNPSSSDSESDDDAEDQRLEALEKELAENPMGYDAHVQYIKSLRKHGHLEKLRQARESMSALFPLSPIMWQEWANDEASLSTGPEDFAAIEKLYERGVLDYLSVPLWCDYVNFVQGSDPSVRECSPAGILKMRDLFERALTAAGLHVAEGNKIWEAYREFEQTIFHAIDESDIEAKEKQIQRIRSIFHRQLSVPLADSGSTVLSFKAWEVEQGNILDVNSSDLDGIPSHVASAYQRAMEMYSARVHFEEQISKQDVPDTERLQHFMIYLKFEQSSDDPSRVQNLYERAVTEFPISSDLWLDYTRYLDQTLKISNVVKGVYSRATKNCTWIGELWVRYLLLLERCHASEKELSAVFELSIQCTFSSFEEYLDLFLTRIDGLRRRISLSEAEDVLDYAAIRSTFQHATNYLSPHLKNADGLLHLHAYWARLELNLGKNLVASRGVWESLLKISGSMLGAWQGYIAMEIELGHINEARSIYKRCYSKRLIGTGSEDICHSWLRFEREFGTLEDFEHAVLKVTPRLEELQTFRSQQDPKGISGLTSQKEGPLKKNAPEKRKVGTRLADEQPPMKRQKDASHNPKRVYGKDKAQKSTESSKVREIESKVENSDTTDEQQIKDSTSEKTKLYTDQCTVFISNLGLQANYEHLHDFFSDVGGVVAIRILKDKFTGKSRGLAYVDFLDDEHLAAALAKNRRMLLGRNLSIARSNPKQGKKRESFGSSTAIEHVEGGSDSKEAVEIISNESGAPQASSYASHRRGEHVELKGKNTFAVPRTVRPLGRSKNEPMSEEKDENPKSNDEFRNMLLKR